MRTITNTSKGLGLRSEHLDLLCQLPEHPDIDFLELAPENWMNIGGLKREQLQDIAQKYPLVAHGLSLSIGDCQPLNEPFVREVARFLDEFSIDIYSEHLSFSRDSQGYLYELLPIPRQKENIAYLVERIQRVQDLIQRPIALENISYYHSYGDEIPEGEFIAEVCDRSGCELLLDINNVYVNSQNHNYCPYQMLNTLPSEAIRYCHIAGHLKERDGFLLDTHGTPVPDQVLYLARYTYGVHGSKPLLLERDQNMPSLLVLAEELRSIHGEILEFGQTLEGLCKELVNA
ncbi:hypothetical protein GCM10007938_09390 [Vibrio zhanjiangensis]|uniref:DUF692 domain-containing protein n=1 Tax=Vibrio zhanjiangensis TaxID=1046128 RepID=A0ABQ6EVV6_9VIBR|nr:DUF692 domain-containing protein [Vibrio zhanjiangensis]GLT17162.1 hypothetical protein GCM10007938_09390 [Vibrio zhanjiangensis]